MTTPQNSTSPTAVQLPPSASERQAVRKKALAMLAGVVVVAGLGWAIYSLSLIHI